VTMIIVCLTFKTEKDSTGYLFVHLKVMVTKKSISMQSCYIWTGSSHEQS